MATRKKPKKYFDIVTGNEIELPEEAVKTEKDIATPDLLEPHFDTATAGEDKMAIDTVKLSASGNPPTVEEVLQREYPEVLRHPDPLNVQIAILRELIRMRGCE